MNEKRKNWLNQSRAMIIAAIITAIATVIGAIWSIQDYDKDGQNNIVEVVCGLFSCNSVEISEANNTPVPADLTLTAIVQTQTEIAKFATPTPTSYTVPTETAIALTLTAIARPSETKTPTITSTSTNIPSHTPSPTFTNTATLTATYTSTPSHTPRPTFTSTTSPTSFVPATVRALNLTQTTTARQATSDSENSVSSVYTQPRGNGRIETNAENPIRTYTETIGSNEVIIGNSWGLFTDNYNANGGCVVFRIYGSGTYTFTVQDGVYQVFRNVETLTEADELLRTRAVNTVPLSDPNCENSSNLQYYQIP